MRVRKKEEDKDKRMNEGEYQHCLFSLHSLLQIYMMSDDDDYDVTSTKKRFRTYPLKKNGIGHFSLCS